MQTDPITTPITTNHTGFDLEIAYKVLIRAFLRIEAAEEKSATIQPGQHNHTDGEQQPNADPDS
jgi:hypothetical protein